MREEQGYHVFCSDPAQQRYIESALALQVKSVYKYCAAGTNLSAPYFAKYTLVVRYKESVWAHLLFIGSCLRWGAFVLGLNTQS